MTAETEADRARAEALAQGLPPTVTDPSVLAKIAMLVSLPLNGDTPKVGMGRKVRRGAK